jgi:hypothetical protein
MIRVPPDPPEGIQNLQSQPGWVVDTALYKLRKTLKSELPRSLFDQLIKHIPDEETPTEPTDDYRKQALEYVDESIAYREKIRPDSLRHSSDLPDKVNRVTIGSWVHYLNGYDVKHDGPRSDADTHEHGKYLFFSPENARELEDIVIEQFKQRPYRSAKIPTKPAKDEDWVLCLYQNDNRYWYDLREEYHNPPIIRFRGFKTDAKTRQGEYSDRYKSGP